MLNFKIYTSYTELPDSWDDMVQHDLMLTRPYLNALQQSVPKNITLYYLGLFKDNALVGMAIVQRVQLYLRDMFRNGSPSAIKTFIKDAVSAVLKGNILVLGNLTHTGQHGIYYLKEEIGARDYVETVLRAVETLKAKIKTETGKTIRVILCKDYFLDDDIHRASGVFFAEKFNKVIVQPNMILAVEPHWTKMEDYLKSLNKKYRARYKRARKLFGNIERRELEIDTIKNCSDQLHRLYLNVSDNAKFNTFILPENHFYSFKKELQGQFRVFGYYAENKLIGFYTLILNHGVLETYFLGYDSEYQYQNQLYLNMLYDMLDFAIQNKLNSIVYARTAMEIKSSVGAKPIPIQMYMKHTNNFFNTLLKTVFNFMKPNQSWEERHPFN